MIYKEFKPHAFLSNYIDVYWTTRGVSNTPVAEKILPDGCVDIIVSLGSACAINDGQFLMRNEGIYLVGPMTKYIEARMDAETRLIGVRFKPGTISSFYRLASLHEIANQTIEMEKPFALDRNQLIQNPVSYFDHLFSNKLNKPNHFLLQVIETIKQEKGQIKVDALAQRHCTTPRQLERAFNQWVGTSPKEFINLIRYQNALTGIQLRKPDQSLLSIAIDAGYYDHAHLTDAFKRYTGVAPSMI